MRRDLTLQMKEKKKGTIALFKILHFAKQTYKITVLGIAKSTVTILLFIFLAHMLNFQELFLLSDCCFLYIIFLFLG